MWDAFSGLVDDLVLVCGGLLRGSHALRDSLPGAPDMRSFVAEQEARPPLVKWPARLERRVGRLKLTMPCSGSACGWRGSGRGFPSPGYETFADFHPASRPDAGTLVIYHHGLSEFPHDASAASILSRGRLRERVDWIAIRGAHHDSPASVAERLTISAESFARGLLSGVFAARALADGLRDRYKHVVLGGMSMGGVITLIEAATGGSFDLYVPLMAGPDLQDVLLRSSFSRIVCRRYRKRAVADLVTGALDIPSLLAEGEGAPIRAALAAYDRLFRIDAQRAAYGRVPRARVDVISGGHITGALQFWALAAHLERALEEALWSGSEARRGARPDHAPASRSGGVLATA